jgi:protein MpaA
VLVVGQIHGDEPAGLAVVEALAARRPRAGLRLWLVATMNPDGRRAGTRSNARGVDLNRNFPAAWRADGRGGRYDPGLRPGSEPETRTAMRFLRRLRPDLTVWYHQPEARVRGFGPSARAARRYATLADSPYAAVRWPPGSAPRWQNTRLGGLAFVVELPPGPLPASAAARHARAVLALSASVG